jgi:mono/diheme cytochrome c family protein
MIRKVAKWLGIALGAVALLLGGFVGVSLAAFSRSMSRVYEVPPPPIERSTDPVVIERGRHLAESVGGCASGDCHGVDLGGGTPIDAGPIGSFAAPNITAGGLGARYTDGELARVVRSGINREGRSIRFMPSQELSWLPDEDLVAIVSYVRSMPAVNRPSGEVKPGVLGRVLDRRDMIALDVARRIDHENRETVPAPAPTAQYGAFLARGCYGCHGEGLSGGRIPGAPPSMAVPLNLTPHETGLAGWSYDDFVNMLDTGKSKDGRALDPMMPFAGLAKMNATEKQALWAYLQSLPPTPFGDR